MKTMKKNGGFTLVELIVVIAILAILAAVAIPAYSGYIEKANRAGDEQLLAAINKAYASACTMNGDDIHLVGQGVAVLTADGSVDYVAKAARGDAYGAAFDTFFAGNESAKFKIFKTLVFVPDLGAFVDINDAPSGSGFTVAYGGGVLKLNPDDIAALKNTTFFESMGTKGMLDKVSDVAGFAALLGSDSAMQSVYESIAFQEHAAAALGVDTSKEGWEDEAFVKIDAMCKELADKEGITWDAAYKQIQANAAVIHAAKNASEMNKDSVISLLTGTNVTATIQGNVSTDPSKALSEAALAYGMYTAYAHSTGNEDLIASTDDPLNILRNLDDPAFKEWMGSDQAKTDLDGYMSALAMVNDTSKDTTAVSTLLVNGFGDADLLAALSGVLDNQ